MNFNPFPILESTNLILRKIEQTDAGDLFEIRRDPLMIEHTDSIVDESIEQTKTYIDKMNQGVDSNKWLIWAIEHRSMNKVIGSVSIWNFNQDKNCAELGFGITPRFQRQGYMSKAIQEVLKFAFQTLKLDYVAAYTEEENLASIGLLVNNGFSEVGFIEEEGYYKTKVFKMIIFRQTNVESNI